MHITQASVWSAVCMLLNIHLEPDLEPEPGPDPGYLNRSSSQFHTMY